MPVYLDLSPLDRLAIVIVRGAMAPGDIAELARHLMDPKVRPFDKIIDVSNGTSDMSADEIRALAAVLRTGNHARGPIAFVVDPENTRFSSAFASATSPDRPVKLFRSLHEARRWLRELRGSSGKSPPAP